MKVVINGCFGGFSLSHKATQWLWEQGVKEIGTPALEYFGGDKKRLAEDLMKWRAGDKRLITQFTPDEEYCIYASSNIDRSHPKLIECVEKFGKEANGRHANLRIVEIPDGIDYTIEEYDGIEHIAETHRTWY